MVSIASCAYVNKEGWLNVVFGLKEFRYLSRRSTVSVNNVKKRVNIELEYKCRRRSGQWAVLVGGVGALPSFWG